MPDWFNDLNACHDRLTLLGIAVTETSIERLTESSQNRLTLLGIAVTETKYPDAKTGEFKPPHASWNRGD